MILYVTFLQNWINLNRSMDGTFIWDVTTYRYVHFIYITLQSISINCSQIIRELDRCSDNQWPLTYWNHLLEWAVCVCVAIKVLQCAPVIWLFCVCDYILKDISFSLLLYMLIQPLWEIDGKYSKECFVLFMCNVCRLNHPIDSIPWESP